MVLDAGKDKDVEQAQDVVETAESIEERAQV